MLGESPYIYAHFHADLPPTQVHLYSIGMQLYIILCTTSHLTYCCTYIILRCDVHARSALPHRRIRLKLWTSLDNVFKERKVLYILHARGFARAFMAAVEAPVTPAAASGNPMNTKRDVLAFNNAKPLRFTGASRITLDRLMKHNIHLPGYLRAYFTCTYVVLYRV